MNNITIYSLHSKISSKFDILGDFLRWLIKCSNKLCISGSGDSETGERLLTHEARLSDINRRYDNISGILLSKYCDCRDDDRAREIFEQYQTLLTSDNFLSLLEHYYIIAKTESERLQKNPELLQLLDFEPEYPDSEPEERVAFLKKGFPEISQVLLDKYNETKITFTPRIRIMNDCICGAKMYLDPITSFKICENCGCEVYMPGTVFDESQFYNQQGQTIKHKKYDPNRHCEKWIDQILAVEDLSGVAFDRVIEKLDARAVKEYTKNGRLRSMTGMKCRQIREWLKEYKLTTKWNDHAPLIRKTITALHGEQVAPPQLSSEEKEEILVEFSMDMNEYEEICKSDEILSVIDRDKIKNKFYYPFGLYKVLCQKLKGDPRLPGLVECIHFQSTDTNVKNDRLHKLICNRRGKPYEPTDRTILIEIC